MKTVSILLAWFLCHSLYCQGQNNWRLQGVLKEHVYSDTLAFGNGYLPLPFVALRLYLNETVDGNETTHPDGLFLFDNRVQRPTHSRLGLGNADFFEVNSELFKTIDLYWTNTRNGADLVLQVENKHALLDFQKRSTAKALTNQAKAKKRDLTRLDSTSKTTTKTPLDSSRTAQKIYLSQAYYDGTKLVDTIVSAGARLPIDKGGDLSKNNAYYYYVNGDFNASLSKLQELDSPQLDYSTSLMHAYLSDLRYKNEENHFFYQQADFYYQRACRLTSYRDYLALEALCDFMLRNQKTKEVIPYLLQKLELLKSVPHSLDDSVYSFFQLSRAYYWAPFNYPGALVRDTPQYYSGQIVMRQNDILTGGNSTSQAVLSNALFDIADTIDNPNKKIGSLIAILPLTHVDSGRGWWNPSIKAKTPSQICREVAMTFDDSAMPAGSADSALYYFDRATAFLLTALDSGWVFHDNFVEMGNLFSDMSDPDIIPRKSVREYFAIQKRRLKKIRRHTADADERDQLATLIYLAKGGKHGWQSPFMSWNFMMMSGQL